MKIHIDLLKEKDAKALFKFEIENRVFFEKSVPSRGEEYYIFENFFSNHRALLKEQKEGISYFYLIKDVTDSIVGRINLVDFDRERKLGHLGYRVGAEYTGKGIANQAVRILTKESETYDIIEIHAKTTSLNIASQKVLEKNNFKRTNFESKAEKDRFIHYIWKKGM